MRKRGRTDANQRGIVERLRDIPGVTVQVLSAVGGGCPDLLVAYRGLNLLLEVKDGSRPPSERRLTPEQEEWHRTWTGHRAVVTSFEQACEAIGVKVAA